MVTWHTVRASDGRREIVEIYDDLEAALDAVVATSWEEPGNAWLSYLEDEDGLAVAVAIFAGDDLLVSITDGRQIRSGMPERYRGIEYGG